MTSTTPGSRRRSGARWAFVLMIGLVSGCRGGDGEGRGAGEVDAPAPGATVTRVPEAGPHRIVIRMTDDMRFEPENPVVAPGDTLIWVNAGQLEHTATDAPGTAAVPEHNSLPPGADSWNSGRLLPDGTFQVILTAPGEYTYLCYLHEAAGMVGHVTVR